MNPACHNHLYMGPFKCYVMQMGIQFSGKKHYEGVRFNVIGITRDWVGVQFPEKKRYVTVEWPLSDQTDPFEVIFLASTRVLNIVFQTFPQDQPECDCGPRDPAHPQPGLQQGHPHRVRPTVLQHLQTVSRLEEEIATTSQGRVAANLRVISLFLCVVGLFIPR